MNTNTNLVTVSVTNEWNPLTRPQIIHRDLMSIQQLLELHRYPVKKLASREVWRIGKGDSIWLLSYDANTLQWILFPHSENLACIITQAINLNRSVSQKVKAG